MNKNYLIIFIILLNFLLIIKKIDKISPKNEPFPRGRIFLDCDLINNKNKKINSIYSKIRIKQGLFFINGFIAYEKSNNFRMIANSFLGKEIDVGSNDEYFWFWSNSLRPKALYYCKHKELYNSRLRDIFYPEILRSFLGIDEIKEQKINIQKETLEKITIFDKEKITGHRLFRNQILVVSADVVEFQKIEDVVLPKKININFLEENIQLEWILDEIQINKFDYKDWKMPDYKEKINISYN